MLEILAQGTLSGLFTGGIVALIALGLTLIWGVMRVFNLAHADFVMVSLFIGYILVKNVGFQPYLTILVLVPLMFLLGVLVAKFLIKPVHK